MSLRNRLKRRPLPAVLTTMAMGILLVSFIPLADLSYDLSYRVRPQSALTNVVLIVADEDSLKDFGDGHGSLSRTNHARLLDRLAADKVPMVFYDFIFKSPDPNPEIDQTLAKAIINHGSVILVGSAVNSQPNGADAIRALPPIEPFRHAARDWGHGEFMTPGTHAVVRQIWTVISGRPCAALAAAGLREPNLTNELAGDGVQWLNYYGEPSVRAFQHYRFEDVLNNEVPADALSGKIVFVGQIMPVAKLATARDVFVTPYSLFGGLPAPGVVLHAISFLNLVRHEWLREVPLVWQWLAALVWAIMISTGLFFLSRGPKSILIGAAICAALALYVLSMYVQWNSRWWWSWLGPATGQTAVAVICAVLWPRRERYLAFVSYREALDAVAAQYIVSHLTFTGHRLFLDKKRLEVGHFDEQLLRQIENSTYFIIILSPGSLKRCAEPGDWVLRELSWALEKGKTIVPVLREGFSFEASDVPPLPEIEKLKLYHGLPFTERNLDPFIEKLTALLESHSRNLNVSARPTSTTR